MYLSGEVDVDVGWPLHAALGVFFCEMAPDPAHGLLLACARGCW